MILLKNSLQNVFVADKLSFLISPLIIASLTILLLPLTITLLCPDNNYCLTFSQKNDQTDAGITVRSSNENKQSGNIDKKLEQSFQEYRCLNLFYLSSLACEAERKGLNASKEEIDIQTDILKRMYPGVSLTRNIPKNEVLAKKYTQSIGIKISIEDIEKARCQMLSDFSDKSSIQETDIEALAETRAIINSPVIKDEVSRINEYTEKLRIQAAINEEFWSLEELRIQSGDDFCIAKHCDSTNCQINTRKYNNLIKYNQIAKVFPLDTARNMIIKQILVDDYILNQAQKKGFDKTDTALHESKSWLDCSAHNAQTKKLGALVTEDHILNQIYNQYYNLLFSHKVRRFYSLIGSSDSNYIDSLEKLVNSVSKGKEIKGDLKNKDDSKMDLPWRSSSGYLLPAEISVVVDTLHESEVSKLIRTSYGYFLARVDSIITVRQEISYEAANKKLVLIASKRKWQNLDSLIAARAFRIYSSSKLSYKSNDTLSVVLYIKPGKNINSKLSDTKEKGFITDTLIYNEITKRGLKLTSEKLPPDLIDSLIKKYDESKRKNNLIGPIDSRYGDCYFKINEVKAGRNYIQYTQIKNRLMDSLMICEVDSNENYWYENPDSQLINLSLSRVYAPKFFEVPDSLMKKRKDKSKNIGNDLRMEYHKSKTEEIQEWINKIRIQIP